MLNMPILKFEKSINYLKSQLQIQNNNKQLILDIITNIGLLINNSSNDELLKYESILESANNYLQVISSNITSIEQLDLEITNITKELNNLLEEQNKTTKTKEFYIAAFSNIKHNIILYSKRFQNIEKKLENDNMAFNDFININNFQYTFDSVNTDENNTNNYEFTGFSINTEKDSILENTPVESNDSNIENFSETNNENEIDNLTNKFKELLTDISQGKITENTASILDDYINVVKSNFNITNDKKEEIINEDSISLEPREEDCINLEIPSFDPVFFDFSEEDLNFINNEEKIITENLDSNNIDENIIKEPNLTNDFLQNNLFEETNETDTIIDNKKIDNSQSPILEVTTNEIINTQISDSEAIFNEIDDTLDSEPVISEIDNTKALDSELVINEIDATQALDSELVINEIYNTQALDSELVINEIDDTQALDSEVIINENDTIQSIENNNNQTTISEINTNEIVETKNSSNKEFTFSDIELLLSNVKSSNSTVEDNFQDVESTLNEISDLINEDNNKNISNVDNTNIIEDIDDTDLLLDILSDEENLVADSISSENPTTSETSESNESQAEKEQSLSNNSLSPEINFDNLNLLDDDIEQKISKILEATTDNEDLIISEKKQKIYLPYKISELVNYINSYPNVYSSLQDVVNQEFVLPFDYFQKHPYKSRFSEAYNIVKNREGKNFFKAMSYSLNLAKKTNLNPAIIAACKTLNELESYLYYLESNNIKRFKFFNIIYQINLI